MNGRLLYYSIVVGFTGFFLGFDTVIISEANLPLKELWKSSDWFHSTFVLSMALWGAVVGALAGGIPTDKLGRKNTLYWIAVLYLISAVGSALATDLFSFLIFRFLGGLGIGASSVVAPLYISEIAPANSRGRLVALFQFNIVIGILLAYLFSYLMLGTGPLAWRWMLGIQVFPALVFLVLVLYVPESPRWLIIKRNLIDEAKKILEVTDPSNADAVVLAIQNSKYENDEGKKLFTSPQYKIQIMLAMLFAVFNQVSGINAVIYYAPRIFEMTGLEKEASLLSTAGIGIVNFIFTLLALFFIDRFGRRKLMYIGSIGLIFTLGMLSKAFYMQSFSGLVVPVLLFAYTGFFAISQGAVIWVFISEIFPNQVRAKGQALGSFTHWFMAAIIAFAFPVVAEKLGGGNTFMIFTAMMVLQLIFVWKLMPETKGKSLEQLEEKISYQKA